MKALFRWIGEQLSDGIEKSTVGAVSYFCIMGCVIYMVVKEGSSAIVDSLLTTAMIVSASLMGVDKVADIFRKTENTNVTRNETLNQTINRTENITESNVPLDNNSSNKNGFDRH